MNPGFLFGSGRMETVKKRSRLPRPQNATLHHWENKLSRPLSSHPPSLPPSLLPCAAVYLQKASRSCVPACQPAWCCAVPRARRLRRKTRLALCRQIKPDKVFMSELNALFSRATLFLRGKKKNSPSLWFRLERGKERRWKNPFISPPSPLSLSPPPLPI